MVDVGTALWGLTSGGAPTLLQTALADTAGEAADVAISIDVVVWNGVAGLLLSSTSAAALAWAALALAALPALVVVAAKRHGVTARARCVLTEGDHGRGRGGHVETGPGDQASARSDVRKTGDVRGQSGRFCPLSEVAARSSAVRPYE